MPTLTGWFLKTALICLVAALLSGALLFGARLLRGCALTAGKFLPPLKRALVFQGIGAREIESIPAAASEK